MQLFFRISIIFIGALLLFIALWAVNSSYYDVSSVFLSIIGRPELKNQFEQAFSLSKFSILKAFLVVFTIFYVFSSVFLYKKANFIVENTKKGFFTLKIDAQYFIKNTLNLSRFEQFLLLFILFFASAKSVYFALTMPISYDEAWTYNYFSSQFPFLAAFYYPAANNHVLFSIVSAFFEKLSHVFSYFPNAVSPVFLIRLPSILACLAAYFVFFGSLKQRFGSRFAFFSLVFLTNIYGVILYSWLARGYAFQFFFVCINLHFFLKIISNHFHATRLPDAAKNLFYYAFSIFLGLYTVPSFLYYWLAIFGIFIILKIKHWREFEPNYSSILPFILANIGVLIAIFIAFTPIFISSNLKIALQHSSFPVGNDFSKAFRYVFNDIFSYFTSNSIFIAIFLVLLTIFSVFFSAFPSVFPSVFKEKNELFKTIIPISLLFVFLPFLFFLLQQAYLPSRIFIFCLPFIAILLAYPFEKFKINIGISLVLFGILFSTQKLNYDETYDQNCEILGEKLVNLQTQENRLNIYTEEAYCKPIILFCFRKNRLPMPNIVCSETQEKPSDDTRFFILKNDSIIGKNDLLKPVFKLKYFSLYEKNK